MSHRLVVTALLLSGWAGCSGCSSRSAVKPRDEPRGTKDAESPSPPPLDLPAHPVVIDGADPAAPCVYGYRGAVIDLGASTDASRFGPRLRPAPAEWVEREGTTWAAVRGKSLSVDFFVVSEVAAEEPGTASPFVQARVRGGAARTLSFYLNGHAIGAATVVRGETRVVAVRSVAAQPVPGANELTIRFSGIAKGVADPSAELEWVHFGLGDPDPHYAAPTRRETIVSRSFGGQPGRALSLRGPGFARCEGWLPTGSAVETRASLEGPGAADAEIRLIRDRVPPTVIGTLHLDAAEASSTRVHSWPLGDVGAQGTLGAVELSVVRAAPGARVVFGEPRVVGPPPGTPAGAPAAMPVAPARGVVLVVMSQVNVRSLSPYGGTLTTPAIGALASSGVVFEANRATSGVAGAVVGAMLTGLPAHDLGLVDGDSRLPRGVTTVADAARPAGIVSAFFTANPLTSAAFGFDRGWSQYEAHAPTEDAPATRVFDAAVSWLADHHADPFLLVVHARGGHPPWDVSLEKAKALPPEGYAGALDPRHASELFGRSAKSPGSIRFDDADRARAGALYAAAMEAEDAGLARLLAALKTQGVDESTTVILTGDVGVNESARVPFAEADSLDEAALATPLVIRWAHATPSAPRVAVATSSEDLATTVLAAFGLPLPATFRGRELHALAAGAASQPESRALLAADQDRVALRWGPFVSLGLRDRETKLCDLSLEAGCVADVRESYPLASRLLHGVLYDRVVNAKLAAPREPASLDAATLAALKLWGR